jgi:hypothetical protein
MPQSRAADARATVAGVLQASVRSPVIPCSAKLNKGLHVRRVSHPIM